VIYFFIPFLKFLLVLFIPFLKIHLVLFIPILKFLLVLFIPFLKIHLVLKMCSAGIKFNFKKIFSHKYTPGQKILSTAA